MKEYDMSERDVDDLERRFSYHPPKDDQQPRYKWLRDEARALAFKIKRHTPPSREQSLALTKLEEVIMHANAAIARNE
jgi:hypothetical protein